MQRLAPFLYSNTNRLNSLLNQGKTPKLNTEEVDMAQFKTNEIVQKLLAMAVSVMFCVGLTACLDLEDEDGVSSAVDDEPGTKDGGTRKDGRTGLFAEEVTNFTKTDVYGAFANQYSLMYEDFSYQDEKGRVSTIPMPFPIEVANFCESSTNSCDPKTVVIKSWISGFTDTSKITLNLSANHHHSHLMKTPYLH